MAFTTNEVTLYRICLLVTCGLPAAGKTSFIRRFDSYLKSSQGKHECQGGIASDDSPEGYSVLHICYDHLLPTDINKIAGDSDDDKEEIPNRWKSYRRSILSCLEEFVLIPLTSENNRTTLQQQQQLLQQQPGTQTIWDNTNNLVFQHNSCDMSNIPTDLRLRFAELISVTLLISELSARNNLVARPDHCVASATQTVSHEISKAEADGELLEQCAARVINTDSWSLHAPNMQNDGRLVEQCGQSVRVESRSRPLLVVIDDNMFYRSMRYEIYQLARKYRTGFVQIYFPIDVSVAVAQHSARLVSPTHDTCHDRHHCGSDSAVTGQHNAERDDRRHITKQCRDGATQCDAADVYVTTEVIEAMARRLEAPVTVCQTDIAVGGEGGTHAERGIRGGEEEFRYDGGFKYLGESEYVEGLRRWEYRTIVVEPKTEEQGQGEEDHKNFTALLSLVRDSLANPVVTSSECDSIALAEEREQSRAVCLSNAVHRADVILRKLVGQHIAEFKASDHDLSKAAVGQYAHELNARRTEILEKIRTGRILLPSIISRSSSSFPFPLLPLSSRTCPACSRREHIKLISGEAASWMLSHHISTAGCDTDPVQESGMNNTLIVSDIANYIRSTGQVEQIPADELSTDVSCTENDNACDKDMIRELDCDRTVGHIVKSVDRNQIQGGISSPVFSSGHTDDATLSSNNRNRESLRSAGVSTTGIISQTNMSDDKEIVLREKTVQLCEQCLLTAFLLLQLTRNV